MNLLGNIWSSWEAMNIFTEFMAHLFIGDSLTEIKINDHNERNI